MRMCRRDGEIETGAPQVIDGEKKKREVTGYLLGNGRKETRAGKDMGKSRNRRTCLKKKSGD